LSPASATLTVVASTISGNSAVTDGTGGNGGGIRNFSSGGSGANATLTIRNCTISGNTAFNGGGILSANYTAGGSATLTVIASTFSGNSTSGGLGGGIYASGTLEIGNTILNAGASGTNIYRLGTATSDGYNLSSDGGSGFLTAVGDQINTNPNLGPLQFNSGPTRTRAPLAGSPAIDQGKNLSSLATDQRGRCRTYDDPGIPNATGGDGSDIGAVEVSPVPTSIVSSTNDNGTSLRWCICEAQSGATITFAPAVTNAITLTGGELLINKNLTIQGPGARALALNGNAASRVFNIAYATVTVSDLTITNGHTTGIGGGIYSVNSVLTISNCSISGNSASFGGGIYNDNAVSGTVLIVASTLSGNSASSSGAGIDNVGGTATGAVVVVASTFSGNSSGTYGGGIYHLGLPPSSPTLKVIASTFSSNSASGGSGGGIYNAFATLEIGDTILKTGASGANLFNSGTVTSDGYNLSSDSGGGFLTKTTDQINTDPKLGPLLNNGGPTFTHALLSNSPAIDKGKSFGVSTDQRGAPRPYDFSSIANASGGDGSDIGAFELGRPTLNIQKLATNAVLSWQSYYGDFTLQSVTNVIASNSWTAVAGTPVVVANQYVLTNGPISGNKFYRLKGN